MSVKHPSPRQNRVTPDGVLEAVAARGDWFGNRGGRIHLDDGTLSRRRWTSRRWICCVLSFKQRQRRVMGASYTEMFFLDEATALAAGHRPCFECRRKDAKAFAAAWGEAAGLSAPPMADAMDLVLHEERLSPPSKARIGDLPDGCMVRIDEDAYLISAGRLWPWSHFGYGAAVEVDTSAEVETLTPACVRAAISAGYRPSLHRSAHA